MRVAYAAPTLKPTSVHSPPTSEMWQTSRSNSSPIRRMAEARGGTSIPTCVFHGLGVGNRVSKAVVSGDRFRDHRSASVADVPSNNFLRAFVSVEVAQLEMQNRVSDDAEAEMSRLNDAGVNRADRDFRDALALHLQESGTRDSTREHCPPDRPSDARRQANSREKSEDADRDVLRSRCRTGRGVLSHTKPLQAPRAQWNGCDHRPSERFPDRPGPQRRRCSGPASRRSVLGFRKW